jgi:hypothetical protein
MMGYENAALMDFAPGDATGLAIPAHGAALREAGVAFLTAAFRAFGSMAADNIVTGITRFEPCAVGSTGEKYFLSVTYARAEEHLPNHLFVKFSRDFRDAFRDRRRGELEAEIRLAELSRVPGFPIAVPKACFADFHQASGSGMIITARIDFGEGGIETLHPKCMDHLLEAPLEHYRAIVTALARLAAAHKAGDLSPQAEALFPFDLAAVVAEDPIGLDEAGMREKVARYAAFAQSYPQLLPAHIATPEFIAVFERDALRFLRYERVVKHYLHSDREFIALCHFNAHIDNAWFWRDADGVLQCGLLDWQRARQMNVAYSLWGGLCGAGLDIWNNHLDELLDLFIAELQAHGGPKLDRAELTLHLNLYTAMIGLAGLINVPQIVLFRLPEATTAAGPLDPVFRKQESARSFLHIFTIFLNLWKAHDFGASLDLVLERTGRQ